MSLITRQLSILATLAALGVSLFLLLLIFMVKPKYIQDYDNLVQKRGRSVNLEAVERILKGSLPNYDFTFTTSTPVQITSNVSLIQNYTDNYTMENKTLVNETFENVTMNQFLSNEYFQNLSFLQIRENESLGNFANQTKETISVENTTTFKNFTSNMTMNEVTTLIYNFELNSPISNLSLFDLTFDYLNQEKDRNNQNGKWDSNLEHMNMFSIKTFLFQ